MYLDGGTLVTSGTIQGGAGGEGTHANGGAGDAILFGPANGLVVLGPKTVLVGAIGGFAAGDVIDLQAKHAASLTFVGNILTVFSGPFDGRGVLDTLIFAGNYTQADFSLTPDGQGGTDIVFAGAHASAQDFMQGNRT